MGYSSTMQVIQRANNTRQYYLICPAPLAQALEIKKGETIEWVVQTKNMLTLKRHSAQPGKTRSTKAQS